MRIGAAQRELTRDNSARFLSADYSCVTWQTWSRRFGDTTLPVEAHFWYKANNRLWWLGKISGRIPSSSKRVMRVLHDPGPVTLVLSPTRHNTALGADRGSWCLQVYQGSSLMRDIGRNVDESRGADIVGADALDSPS